MVRNWNECIVRAEGQWLLLMCSDDLFVSGSIIDIIDFINNHVDEPSLIIQDPLAVKPFIKKAPGAKTVQSINLPIASGNMWHKSISSALGIATAIKLSNKSIIIDTLSFVYSSL